MKKYAVIMLVIGIILISVGSYAMFSYNKTTSTETSVLLGDIYLNLIDGDSISLTNMFPETRDEALDPSLHNENIDKNYATFNINGTNTSDKDIFYEIYITHGDSIPNKNRIKDELMVYELSQGETILSTGRYKDILDQTIYVGIVNSESDINENYKLRIWMSDSILISDTDPKADYSTEEYANLFTSIKVGARASIRGNNPNKTFTLIGNSTLDNTLTYSSPKPINSVTGNNTLIIDGKKLSLDLGEVELHGIGNITDTITKENGNWYLNQKFGKIILDGSENYTGINVLGNTILASLNPELAPDPLKVSLSSHLIYNASSGVDSVSHYFDSNLYFKLPISALSSNDLDGVRDFISSEYNKETPLTFVYQLLSPTSSQITDTKLINQLNMIDSIINNYNYSSGVINSWNGTNSTINIE